MVYTNLKMLMAAKSVSIDSIATLLNVHRNTVANKINGESAFDFDQAMTIASTFFPEYRPTYIFKRFTVQPTESDTTPS